MERKIIKVIPIKDEFSLTWMIGKFCNYDCMYCPEEYHTTDSQHHSLETLKKSWDNIFNNTKHQGKKYKINFTGGEPTANKNFLPFLTWLWSQHSDDINRIAVTSNGSASLGYYTKLSDMVTDLSLSTHSEFMNEEEFFKKCMSLNKIMIEKDKSLHINIMKEKWNIDRIPMYRDLLERNNVSYSVNEIDYSRRIRDTHQTKGVMNIERIL